MPLQHSLAMDSKHPPAQLYVHTLHTLYLHAMQAALKQLQENLARVTEELTKAQEALSAEQGKCRDYIKKINSGIRKHREQAQQLQEANECLARLTSEVEAAQAAKTGDADSFAKLQAQHVEMKKKHSELVTKFNLQIKALTAAREQKNSLQVGVVCITQTDAGN